MKRFIVPLLLATTAIAQNTANITNAILVRDNRGAIVDYLTQTNYSSTGQFIGNSGFAASLPAFTFASDLTTGIVHGSAATQFFFVGGGAFYGGWGPSGHFLIGTTNDTVTGFPLQIISTTITGVEANGFGGSGSFYARLAAGTAASPTPTTVTQVGRFGVRGIDTAGATTYSLGANAEFTPTGTWGVSDHGMLASLAATPSGTTTRVVNFQDTGKSVSISGTTATTPNVSTILDIQGTTGGLGLPELTTTQRDALTTPTKAVLIRNTTLGKNQVYNVTKAAWLNVEESLPSVALNNWIIPTLTLGTAATTTVTVTGALANDYVDVDQKFLANGTCVVLARVTSLNTITVYAIPTVTSVTAQTNSFFIQVRPQ